MPRSHGRGAAVGLLAVGLLIAAPLAQAQVTLTQTIGDRDCFSATQPSPCVPGNPYTVFILPSVPIGTYTDVAATDRETQGGANGYQFVFNFALDATGLQSITGASLFIQTGSLGKELTRGFGNANVMVNGTSLGPLSTVLTTSATEERLRGSTFGLLPFAAPGAMNTFQVRLSGASVTTMNDIFAIDFAEVTVEGIAVQAVAPEPGALPLVATGLAALGVVAWRRRAA